MKMLRSIRLLALPLGLLLLSCTGAGRLSSPEPVAQEGPEGSGVSSQAAARQELAQWRARIDAADRELVALLNRRAEYVLKLAPLKRQIGAAVRDPGREQEVLRKLREANRGRLPDEAFEKIYASIMAAMRDLQSQN